MKIIKHCCFIFLLTIAFLQKIKTSEILLQTLTGSDNNCVFTLKDGNMVDISSLKKLNGDYTFEFGRYIYKANFCGTQISRCSGLMIPASINIKPSLCISKLTYDWSPKMEYIDDNNINFGVKLTFPPGEKCFMSAISYSLSYHMNCNLNKEIEFTSIKKISSCIYEYHFETKYACSINFITSSIWTSKNVLLIIFFLFTFYCVGFSVMNYRKNPEDGVIKSLPHREFWREFFDNANVGASIIFKFVREKIDKLLARNSQLGYQ